MSLPAPQDRDALARALRAAPVGAAILALRERRACEGERAAVVRNGAQESSPPGAEDAILVATLGWLSLRRRLVHRLAGVGFPPVVGRAVAAADPSALQLSPS